jgi:hypothetical protein
MNSADLLPLRPIGLGGAEIEALPSYLQRLGSAHGLTSGQLIGRLASRHSAAITQSLGAFCNVAIIQFLRPNDTTESLVAAMAEATGLDSPLLRSMTFLPLRQALDRPLSTFAPSFRWCPLCFADADSLGQEPYFKLSWQLLGMQGCALHGAPLRERCPSCDSKQRGTWRPSSISVCQACKLSLSLPLSTEKPLSDPMYLGSDLVELVRHIGSTPGFLFPADGVSKVVSDLYDSAWQAEREADLWKKIPRDECIRFHDRTEPITLLSARRVAFRLDVPLVDLLLGESQNVCRSFCFGADFPLPNPIRPKSRHRIGNLAEVRRRFIEFATVEIEPPISLLESATKLGVSTGALRYHFPQEVAEIGLRMAQFRAREAARKTQNIRKVVLDTIVQWPADLQVPLSKKAVLRILLEATELPKHGLRMEISHVFDTLGLSGP